MATIDEKLQDVLEWANQKAQDETNPPWAYDHYETLQNTLAAIIAGRACTITMEDLRQLDEHQVHDLPPGANTDRTNIVPLHPQIVRVRMPM